MADVHVHVTNKSGGKTSLLMDDEQDAERIEYLKKLVKRDELDEVKVTKPRAAAKPSGDDK